MKTLAKICSRSHREHFAVPRTPKLSGQWQRGIETMSGQTQWKLHLTLAGPPSPAFETTNDHEQSWPRCRSWQWEWRSGCLADMSIRLRNPGLARQHGPSELCPLVISNQGK